MPNISTNQKTHIPPTAPLDFYVLYSVLLFDFCQTLSLYDRLVLLSAPSPVGINGVCKCAVIRSANLGNGQMIAGD